MTVDQTSSWGWDRRRMTPAPRQVWLLLGVALVATAVIRPMTHNTFFEVLGEALFVGVLLVLAFNAAGAWRQPLLPRWLVQLIGVVLAAALGPLIVQLLTAGGDFSRFVESRPHVHGYVLVVKWAAIIGTALAAGALIRESTAAARARALQTQLQRETRERQASDARLQLLTAQVQPHFLLNTLANVQALLESGSPRAVPVFRSLIAYLRATLPQLQQEHATLGDEEKLVAAYLELMHMRMPDRLSFRTDIEPALRETRFPPMVLLTLVENAIRHGIDPGTEAGSVEVGARRVGQDGMHLWVADTGVGLSETAGEGTGLANLKARLQAFFGEDAQFELSEQAPHGVRADLRVRRPLA